MSLFLAVVLPTFAGQISLAWNDNSTNETGFKIERAPDGASFTQIATVGANVTTYVDATVAPSTAYWYRVRATSGSGDSAYTNVVNATTPGLPNTAPTISNISNATATSGSSTGPLGFTVGDAETAAGSLTVAGASSNVTLVPTSAIVFGGSGSSRTVTVTPAAGQSGSSTITVTVSDGTLTASDTFTVTVTEPANTAPTIGSIPNQTVTAGSSTGAIAFTIGDAQTSASSLSLSGSSGNTTLVPNAGIVFGGSGSSRTVTVTPAAGQTGSAVITVTVSDGTATANTTFTVTVAAASQTNTPPTIASIPNQTITAGGSTGAIAFTVGDAETAASSLTLSGSSSNTTLVPNGNLAFGGSGSNRTVTVTPAANQTGSATIAVSVRDGAGASTTSSFLLTVNAAQSGSGLVAAYGFNEATGTSVTDASGSNNNGTIQGATRTTSGKFGGALNFNGASNLVSVKSSASLSFSKSMTLEAWVCPTASQSSWRTIVQKLDAYYLHASSDSSLTPAGGIVANGDALEARSSSAVAVNSWTHVAMTYDGANVRLYINGAVVSTKAANVALVANGNDLYIGGNNPFGEYFQGMIDEVRVYNRALTQAEIQSDMNKPVGNATPNTAPSISDVANQTTSKDTPTNPIGFTVGDAETAADTLTVTGASSNATLVPNSAIAFGGSGSSRTVTVTPAPGQTGSATITVTVSDGALSASDTFTVNVTAPANNGLVAAYGFNESTGTTVTDTSGSGNNGVIQGATRTTSGKFGGALNFNGASNLVSVKSSASLSFSKSMTLEAWVCPSASQSGWRTIVQKLDAYYLHASSDSSLTPAGGIVANGDALEARSPSAVAVKSWTHVAMTYDGANVRLYINGAVVSTKAANVALIANANDLYIGGNNPFGEYFQGMIDEVRIYNRSLSAAEIQADMQTPVASQAASPIASTWGHGDIGSVGIPGSDDADANSANITVKGSGTDIWNNQDSFRFVYRALKGDGVIEARVDSLTNTDPWAKAGVMIRSSLEANASNAMVLVRPSNEVCAQARVSTGGSTSIAYGPGGSPTAYWVRLERKGNAFIASWSTDGVAWQTVTTFTIAMETDVYAGFAVTSHNNDVQATGVFSEPFIQ